MTIGNSFPLPWTPDLVPRSFIVHEQETALDGSEGRCHVDITADVILTSPFRSIVYIGPFCYLPFQFRGCIKTTIHSSHKFESHPYSNDRTKMSYPPTPSSDIHKIVNTDLNLAPSVQLTDTQRSHVGIVLDLFQAKGTMAKLEDWLSDDAVYEDFFATCKGRVEVGTCQFLGSMES